MYIDTFNAVEDPKFYNCAPGGDGWYGKKEEEKGLFSKMG